MAAAEPIDVAVLLVYAAAMVGFGVFSYTRVRGFAEYYDGGRRWGVLLIGFAVAATNMGAANTVGSVALAYREGLSAAWYVTLQAAAFIPFALLAVPKFYPLTETTLAEYLENRYQAWLRPVSATALALATFAILPAQIVGGSSVIVALTGINYTLAFIGVGSCLVVYTSLGGLPSITYADTVQWLIVIAGFAVGVPLVVAHSGGLRAVIHGVPASHASWWTGASGGWGFLTILAWSVTVFIARFGSQEWYQRIRAARSPRAARRGLMLGGGMAMPFGLLTMLVGVSALAQFPHLARPEEAFARAMMGSVPLGWRALMMGAILAAVVSSGESSVNAATALFVNDLCRPYIFKARSDRFYLRLSQIACAMLGFAALGLALVAPGIVEYVRLGFLIRTPVALTVLTGLFWRGASASGAAAGIVAGTLAVLLWQWFGTARLDTFWIGTPVTLLGLYVGSQIDRYRSRPAAPQRMDI